MLSGGTDLKAFTRLGIRGFGFAPLELPADLDFSGMFHGVDERVPVDSLQFGVRVLDRFLDYSCSIRLRSLGVAVKLLRVEGLIRTGRLDGTWEVACSACRVFSEGVRVRR